MSPRLDMKQMLPEMVSQSRAAGATDADAISVEARAVTVRVRNGEVELVERANQRGIGFRAFAGEAHATSSTSDLSSSSVRELVKTTCDRAGITEAVEGAGLADPEQYGEPASSIHLWDEEAAGFSVEDAVAMAIRAEASALSADERLSNSEGGEMSVVIATTTLANSHGLLRQYSSTRYTLSAVPIAKVGDEMVRDWWMTSARFQSDLLSPEEVGETAARRTLSRLGATVPKTTQVPVVFSPMMGGRIMGAVSNALNGYSLVNKASFLLDSLGETVGSELVTLTDDATIDRGLGSRPFDGEGLPARQNVLLEKGVVKSYLLDSYTGRKLGMASTHNASRSLQSAPSVSPTNLCLSSGSHSGDEIIASVKDGLYVTELFGFGVNGITGDYSQGAAGFWIRDGKLAEPVHEFTIAGNLKSILGSIELVGNDPHLQSSVRCPTFKVAELMVAGR